MHVLIPSPLFSYTGGPDAEAEGGTLGQVLDDLERQYPGIRFRVVDEQERLRAHMRFFVNGEQVFELDHALQQGDSVQIVQALSGG
jgi:molybdopterin converting factor small subunit